MRIVSRLAATAALAVCVPLPAVAQDTSHVEAHGPVADSVGPIITPEGVTLALELPPAVQREIARHVIAIDAHVRKMVWLHQRHSHDQPESERHQLHHQMEAMHNEMAQHHAAISASLTLEQQNAFMHYVHERAEAAGLKMMEMGNSGTTHEHGEGHH